MKLIEDKELIEELKSYRDEYKYATEGYDLGKLDAYNIAIDTIKEYLIDVVDKPNKSKTKIENAIEWLRYWNMYIPDHIALSEKEKKENLESFHLAVKALITIMIIEKSFKEKENEPKTES